MALIDTSNLNTPDCLKLRFMYYSIKSKQNVEKHLYISQY